MTDQPRDDDLELGRQLKAQEELYNSALESDVTHVATNWLYKAYLLSEIAGDDLDAAKSVIHTVEGWDAAHREFDTLTEHERIAFGKCVGLHFGRCLRAAIGKLWHACGVLEIDTSTLDPDHVALHAATLLSDDDMVPELDTRKEG
jgi:hypothetical protein